MCGVAGVFSSHGRPVALEGLPTMRAMLAPRGPDDNGVEHLGRKQSV